MILAPSAVAAAGERSEDPDVDTDPGSDAERLPQLSYGWTYLEWGGVQIYFLNLMRAARRDFRVRALLPTGSSPTLLAFLRSAGADCRLLPDHSDQRSVRGVAGRLARRWRKLRAERQLRGHLERSRQAPEIVHVDVAPWSSSRLLCALAERRATFVTLHTRLPRPPTEWHETRWRAAFERLAKVPGFGLLTANLDVRQSLVPYLGAERCALLPVAYSGVDLDEIGAAVAGASPEQLRLELQLPVGRTLVTAAGQFVERKGCWDFIEVAASLSHERPDLHFVWFGTESLSEADRRRVSSRVGRESFTHLSPRESGTTRIEFLRSLASLTDVFVLPSYVEGLPLVLVEVMAMAKPIAASRINAVPEALTHERSGLLFEAGDLTALAESVCLLVDSPERGERLGLEARRVAEQRFDQRLTSEITLSAYRQALAGAAS